MCSIWHKLINSSLSGYYKVGSHNQSKLKLTTAQAGWGREADQPCFLVIVTSKTVPGWTSCSDSSTENMPFLRRRLKNSVASKQYCRYCNIHISNIWTFYEVSKLGRYIMFHFTWSIAACGCLRAGVASALNFFFCKIS
jgi:hypothetical protein